MDIWMLVSAMMLHRLHLAVNIHNSYSTPSANSTVVYGHPWVQIASVYIFSYSTVYQEHCDFEQTLTEQAFAKPHSPR